MVAYMPETAIHFLGPIQTFILFTGLETLPAQTHSTPRETPKTSNKVYILDDYHTDYKTRLIRLNLLPITYTLDMADIMFFINSLKNPTDNFNISSFTNNPTRSFNCKLKHIFMSNNQSRNFIALNPQNLERLTSYWFICSSINNQTQDQDIHVEPLYCSLQSRQYLLLQLSMSL